MPAPPATPCASRPRQSGSARCRPPLPPASAPTTPCPRLPLESFGPRSPVLSPRSSVLGPQSSVLGLQSWSFVVREWDRGPWTAYVVRINEYFGSAPRLSV